MSGLKIVRSGVYGFLSGYFFGVLYIVILAAAFRFDYIHYTQNMTDAVIFVYGGICALIGCIVAILNPKYSNHSLSEEISIDSFIVVAILSYFSFQTNKLGMIVIGVLCVFSSLIGRVNFFNIVRR